MSPSFESAADGNRHNAPGTLVRILLRDDSARKMRTCSYATQSGALAVLALDEQSGRFTTAALQPVKQ